MLIQLKQNDIEAAIRLYLAQQGINTADKQVNVAFSYSRKAQQTFADVEISDLHGVSEKVTTVELTTGEETTSDTQEPEVAQETQSAEIVPIAAAQAASEDDGAEVGEEVAAVPAAAEPVAAKPSLFG